jgi:hypothetical protein
MVDGTSLGRRLPHDYKTGLAVQFQVIGMPQPILIMERRIISPPGLVRVLQEIVNRHPRVEVRIMVLVINQKTHHSVAP